MNNLKEFYENINILGKNNRCAMYTESMGSAICLVGIEHGVDDYALFYRIDGDNWGKTTKAKIQFTKKGRAFFISRNKRVFLENFLRTY